MTMRHASWWPRTPEFTNSSSARKESQQPCLGNIVAGLSARSDAEYKYYLIILIGLLEKRALDRKLRLPIYIPQIQQRSFTLLSTFLSKYGPAAGHTIGHCSFRFLAAGSDLPLLHESNNEEEQCRTTPSPNRNHRSLHPPHQVLPWHQSAIREAPPHRPRPR